MCRGRKGITGLALILVLAAALAPASYAATPQDIYNDFADNGQLDQRYTQAELEAALQNATLQEYPGNEQGGQESFGAAVQGQAAQQGVGSLPFTGLDLALLSAGGAALLMLGFGLRRLSARTE